MTEAYYTDEKNLEKDPKENRMPASPISVIGIGAAVTHRPLPHHRAYGSRTRRFESVALTFLEQ